MRGSRRTTAPAAVVQPTCNSAGRAGQVTRTSQRPPHSCLGSNTATTHNTDPRWTLGHKEERSEGKCEVLGNHWPPTSTLCEDVSVNTPCDILATAL